MKEIIEFKYLPIDSIVLEPKIEESNIDINKIINEIKDKGLIRPLIVSKINNEFVLKLGTRRFLAFKKLKYANIFCGIIDGDAELDEINAIALCYTELDEMLTFKDKAQALKYLLKDNDGKLNKVSSKTNISIDEINTILNYEVLVENIIKNIKLISNTDEDFLIKKSRLIDPKDLKKLNNFLEKLI
ncbi:MAG: ParB N-terminal domain-containing protein [Dehalococcoidia bacterium]|tara:strand:+ start:73 stop:633 length:561 start_codon:yes stop_codon:yes gene_type:complete